MTTPTPRCPAAPPIPSRALQPRDVARHHARSAPPFPVAAGRIAFVAALVLACAPGGRPPAGTAAPAAPVASAIPTIDAARLPRTRAERSAYRETSTHADVVDFLAALRAAGAPITVGSVGTTFEGRDIPYVIASRPLVHTPDEAHALGRPVVYVQGNIHAGEVEGKESLQAILRDLSTEPRANVLDSLVLIAVPIYNGDGNERVDAQARNRPSQHGPERVGQRPNAQGLDLNRDYTKVDAPETAASLRMFARWRPHVFVDLHTTNGSYHGYNLTHAPSLNPAGELPGATFGGAYARDSLLPELERRVRLRHQVESFPYGNFAGDEGVGSPPRAWMTYDHRPRFGTNYFALRGGISVLSEAYSHDPFDVRVRATTAFVRELLSLVAERAPSVRRQVQRAQVAVAGWPAAATGARVPVRAVLTQAPRLGDVRWERLEASSDTVGREPGVRRGVRRTGDIRVARVPIHDRFQATLTRPVPWGYAVAREDTAALRILAAHGVTIDSLTEEWSGDAGPQFVADSVEVAPRPFQGRREARVTGRWVGAGTVRLPAGTRLVPAGQPLGVVVMYLLEPESDDGLFAWDVAGRASAPASVPAVIRLARRPDARAVRLTPISTP